MQYTFTGPSVFLIKTPIVQTTGLKLQEEGSWIVSYITRFRCYEI